VGVGKSEVLGQRGNEKIAKKKKTLELLGKRRKGLVSIMKTLARKKRGPSQGRRTREGCNGLSELKTNHRSREKERKREAGGRAGNEARRGERKGRRIDISGEGQFEKRKR